MHTPCFITGRGMVTVQGVGVAENWASLLAGRVLLDTGIVPLPRDQSMPRVCQLAIAAAREAHVDAGSPPLDDDRTALVVGTSKGPIEDWIDQLNGVRPPDITLGVSRVAADVATALGHANGPRATLAGACASGLHALIHAVDLIRRNACDHALVVAAEASTCALFRANFQRLGVLAEPGEACRPFDVNRRGFHLAEGAAAVMISRNRGKEPIAITSTACLADGFHLVSPDSTAASLTKVLRAVHGGRCIDVVYAHGTGTLRNDSAEIAAISRVLSDDRPRVYTHKHSIGHTQGAAGLLSVVQCVDTHGTARLPGNSATLSRMPHAGVLIEQQAVEIASSNSVIIAAGFGGTIGCLCLSTTQ